MAQSLLLLFLIEIRGWDMFFSYYFYAYFRLEPHHTGSRNNLGLVMVNFAAKG